MYLVVQYNFLLQFDVILFIDFVTINFDYYWLNIASHLILLQHFKILL